MCLLEGDTPGARGSATGTCAGWIAQCCFSLSCSRANEWTEWTEQLQWIREENAEYLPGDLTPPPPPPPPPRAIDTLEKNGVRYLGEKFLQAVILDEFQSTCLSSSEFWRNHALLSPACPAQGLQQGETVSSYSEEEEAEHQEHAACGFSQHGPSHWYELGIQKSFCPTRLPILFL
ncbi:hypothetical protein EYF80_036367 [Liparis tanakae]|uniref:Uncharacterized protein n=1 Tax=Liparis tanakae TaxID=230148 RepID=A0A4Z2GIY5_9TELE|nr:hypothetical protein EYF80_036367 [Liparis tanakae]